MSGKAKTRKTFGTKLKDQQNDNKTFYNLANQGTIMSSGSSVVTGGSIGGGTVLQGMANDLYMNTYDIVDLDRLRFAVKEGAGEALTSDDYGIEAIYTGGNAYGMQIKVPATKSLYFYSGTGQISFSDTLGMIINKDINLSGSDLKTVDDIYFNTVANNDAKIGSISNGIQYDATLTNTRAGQYHLFTTHGTEAGDARFAITDDAVITYEHFLPEPNDTQNLGSSTKRFKKLYLSDEINSLGNLTIGGTSALIGVVTLSDDLICAPIVIDKSASKITSSTGAIGYETTNNSTVVGSVGTMQLPYISDTTASPTDGELDGWFGDTNGCVGIQFTGTAHRIWVKSDSEWVKNFLT